jgi:predicted porin
MQKNIIVAALALCGAGAAMAQTAPASKVELWGIVDAAVRHTNNEGVNQKSKTQMIGGGMSQSRWGINVTEDLGGGNTALVVLENRLNADDGSVSTPFFQLANLGLQTPYGRLTAGRQWNVLFDVVTSTYASFPYSPYMEAYKPEFGLAMGARTSNMLKYTFATPNRSLVGSLQYSFDENNDTKALEAGLPASAAQVPAFVASTLGGGAWKTFGGYLRYAPGNGLAVGGGYLRSTLPGGTDVDAWTLGGSYRTGPWYLSAGYGLNKAKFAAAGANPIQAFRNVVDGAILGQFWAGQSNGGFIPGNADKRQLFKLGVGYQATPQLNLGLHYFHGKQTGSATGLSNGKANFVVAVADYAFSKRTDAYVGIDNTRLSGGDNVYLDAASKARSRTGFTIGLRHRF